MRPLSGVAVTFILLTDLSSGVWWGSSCFSDRNIWDFLSPEAAVSWYVPLSSKVDLQHSKWQKSFRKRWRVRLVKASHITHWLACVGLSWVCLIFFCKSSAQQFTQIEIHLLKLPNSQSEKQTAPPNTLPQLLGFLQLSLYKSSAIADFHLLGRSASSCLSSFSPEDNKQTMKTLTWKPFPWAEKWFLAGDRQRVCVQWPLTLVSLCHMQHHITTTLAKRCHVLFSATSQISNATSCEEISLHKVCFYDCVITKASLNILSRILRIILDKEARKKS